MQSSVYICMCVLEQKKQNKKKNCSFDFVVYGILTPMGYFMPNPVCECVCVYIYIYIYMICKQILSK